ncbi:MAG: hypothetical protein C4520_18140 [Candidatus Abyssobacteria bacterium SURF_5]|uniref:YfhO family protein n=1 Tax=Abyssobacteria bacterium (strain SURF_5) TaxID=2093360 RepID=A0A3A4NE90_ABYX5|nr:MAG: hypothetical protein C4520_18140 [Candidatus Abyssubacteria bacterium SURF_5]
MKTNENAFTFKKKNSWFSPLLTPTLLSLLVLFFFALIFWWTHVQQTQAQNRIIAGSNADMYVYHLPVREFAFSSLSDGSIPLYNPYTNCGMPFLATYQAALFYPLNFPHLFLEPARALSLIYLLHIFLAGAFMFFWMRELRVSETAATFSGAAYMFCWFVVYILTWPHIVLTHVWIPLVFLLIHRAFSRGRVLDMILLSAAVASQFLAGYMQGFVYTLYGAFAYLLYLTVIKLEQAKPGAVAVGRSFLVCLLGLTVAPALLSAIQWIPTFQLSTLSTRPPGGLSLAALLPGGSLYPSMFLAAIINPDSYKWQQYTLYPGVVALLLAVFAFVQRERWRETFFFAVLAVVASLIAFGMHTPLFRLYMLLPTGDWFRLPNRLLILTAFSIATLAGIGCSYLIDNVLQQPPQSARTSVRLGIFVALAALLLLLIPKAAGVYIFVLLIGCLLAVRARSAAPAGMLAIVLVALDLLLYVSNPVTYPWITPQVFPELTEAKQVLKEKIGTDRVHIFHVKNDWKNYLLNSNFGMIERIRETAGYESLSLQRFAEFCSFMETGGQPSYDLPFTGSVQWNSEAIHPHMLNLLGARYIIEDPGRDLYPESKPKNRLPKSFKLKKVYSGDVNIYENSDALPRAFFTTQIEVVPDKYAALQRLADPAFDYRNTILLEEQPQSQAPLEGEKKRADVLVEQKDRQTVQLVVDAPAAGFVFLDDMYLPGWRVTVDAREVEPYRADYLFIAIPVEAGKHVIEVQYLPAGYRVGKWISIISITLFAFLLAYDLARRRAKSMAPWEPETKVPTLTGRKKALPSAGVRVKKQGRG